MTQPLSRRSFLHLSAASAAAAWTAACQSPVRRKVTAGPLRFAAIGTGGMGEWDLKHIASHPSVQVVALCDVDRARLDAAGDKHPDARRYQDWRELLRAEAGRIDGISCSTPDHMHAPIVMTALSMGLHVYGQKPLTHTVVEARALRAAARQAGVATQMGIQNRSNTPYLTAKKVFDRGLTGPVQEVHVWTDRPAGWWPQDVDRPVGEDPVPEGLDWDLWLGVAPERPYKEGAYHSFVWRGRKDFGTGAQGDMACHLMDPALWFLGLGDPLTVRSLGPKPKADSFPLWSRIECTFQGTPSTVAGPVPVTWHDGAKKPDALLARYGIQEPYDNACLFAGDQGALLVSPYDPCRFWTASGEEVELDVEQVPQVDHWHQWVEACLGGAPASAEFEYSGLLTEVALLGNIALEFPGETLRWNPERMRLDDHPQATRWLHKDYRSGWEVRGL